MTIHEPLPAPDTTERTPLLTSQMLSAELGVPEDTIRGWRMTWKKDIPEEERRGPRPYKLGGLVRYRRSEVDEWIDACAFDHEEDPGDDA